MQVIHFTEGATDPIHGFGAHRVRHVALAAGQRDTDVTVSCYHLGAGGRIGDTPFVHDCVLLLVVGRLTFWWESKYPLDLSAGMGIVLSAGEPFVIEADEQAILVAVESPQLSSMPGGISTPTRIMGQRWPGERPTRMTVLNAIRLIARRIRGPFVGGRNIESETIK